MKIECFFYIDTMEIHIYLKIFVIINKEKNVKLGGIQQTFSYP